MVQSKDAVSSQKLVLDWSPELEGLARDMPLQQALARHDSAELIPSDIPYYRSAFKEILDGLEQVSPLVEGNDLGCVYIGADGLQLIYPNDSALINAVREVTADFMPQMGIAGNKFLASLAAQQSRAGRLQDFLGRRRGFPEGLTLRCAADIHKKPGQTARLRHPHAGAGSRHVPGAFTVAVRAGRQAHLGAGAGHR